VGRLTLLTLALVACTRTTGEVHAEDAAPPLASPPRAPAPASASAAPSQTSAAAAETDSGKHDGGAGRPVTKATVALASYDEKTLAPDRAKIDAAAADVVECTKKTPGYFATGDQFFVLVEYDAKGVPHPTAAANRVDTRRWPKPLWECLDKVVQTIAFSPIKAGPLKAHVYYDLE